MADLSRPFVENSVHGDPNVVLIHGAGALESRLGVLDPQERVREIAWSGQPLFDTNALRRGSLQFIEGEPERELGEVSQWLGEGLRLLRSVENNSLLFVPDAFGFGTLFYAVIPNRHSWSVVAGLTFRAVHRALAILGFDDQYNKVSWSETLPGLLSNHNFFRTRASSQSFSQSIQTLHAEEMLRVSSLGVSISRRPHKSGRAFGLTSSDSSYRALLREGIDNAARQIQKLVRSGQPAHINLSGGKDSRMLLALVLASGCEKDITVTTTNPFNLEAGATKDILMKDLRLASTLVEHYGMKWNPKEGLRTERMTFLESLARWQNFRSNDSFEIRPSLHITGPENVAIELSGIGGELVRSYLGADNRVKYPGWWSRSGGSPLTLDSDLRGFFEVICPKGDVGEGLYRQAREKFVGALQFHGASDVISAIDQSYPNYRSRAHAGVGAFNSVVNKLTAYPICQPEFVMANSFLEREDQEDGRVIFDVMAIVDTALVRLDFASPAWPTRFFEGLPQREEIEVDGAESLEQYLEVDGARSNPPVRGQNIQVDDFKAKARERVIENAALIADTLSTDGIDPTEIINRTAHNINVSENALYAMLGKTESIRDVVEPAQASEVQLLTFDLSRGDQRREEIAMHSYSTDFRFPTDFDVSRVKQLVDELDLSNVVGVLSLDELQDEVTLKLESLPGQIQVAVYWYVDGEKVETVWYQDDPLFTLTLPRGTNLSTRIRAMVFLKRQGEVDAGRVFNIEL